MNHRIWIIILVALLTGCSLPAQNPFIQHYTTADGLPSNTVYYVFQDSRKFIWFATDAGVTRFNGNEFKTYTKKDGLSFNSVVRIMEDSYERVWFICWDAAVNFIHKDVIHNEINTPFLDSLRFTEPFLNIFEGDDKTILFYNRILNDIYALDSCNHVRILSIPFDFLNGQTEQYQRSPIFYLNKDSTGTFYIWTSFGKFSLKNFSSEPVLISDSIRFNGIFPASGNSLYVSYAYKGTNEWRIRKICANGKWDQFFSPLKIASKYQVSIYEDSWGNLWITTYDNGVFCFKDGRQITHLDIRNPFSLCEDNERNIWISSHWEGVYKINPLYLHHKYFPSSCFQNSRVTFFTNHIQNGVWCTNGKTVSLIQNNILYTSDFYHEGGSIIQLGQLNDSTLLLADMNSNGIVLKGIELDTGSRKVSFHSVQISPVQVGYFIFNSKKTEICSWFWNKLFFLKPDMLFDDLKMVDLGNYIYNAFYTTSDELIVSLDKNYRYRNGKLEPFPEGSKFSKIKFLLIENLAFNTKTFIDGDSIYMLHKEEVFNLSEAFDNPIDRQPGRIILRDSVMYIQTAKNILICEDPRNLLKQRNLHIRSLSIGNQQINDIICDTGYLIIAIDNGLVSIPCSSIREIEDLPPIPYFQTIQVNDQLINTEVDHVELQGRNRIYFGFASKNYSSDPAIYSYMLSGTDSEWLDALGSNVVYQNLSPGEYVFKLRARKAMTTWSQPIEFRVLIRYTIWQHPLFFVGLSVILFILVVLTIVWQKNLQMKKREMDHNLVLLEQKALQSMMNPHFIFNALGSIQSFLLKNKPGEAGLYLSQFARLIRQNLSAINSPMISLEEELDRLKNYLDLERFRMSEGFDYSIELDESVEDEEIRIPSMIIQPFVENAILHGISPLKGDGLIRLLISKHDEKSIEIIVEDNGIGMQNSEPLPHRSEKHLHMGMEMTRKRLEILGKKMHVPVSVSITSAFPDIANPGTRVVLVVPVDFGSGNG